MTLKHEINCPCRGVCHRDVSPCCIDCLVAGSELTEEQVRKLADVVIPGVGFSIDQLFALVRETAAAMDALANAFRQVEIEELEELWKRS